MEQSSFLILDVPCNWNSL